MAPEKRLQITEHDNAGNVAATYIHSAATSKEGSSRIDVVLPKETKLQWQKVLDIFLPAGYPHSVTDDYLEYQIYDSLQAFTSSLASLLSSRSVLTSVGVGNSTATPTHALLLSIASETASRLATISFATLHSTALEPESKKYRLLADVLNDVAFVLDSLSPLLPWWLAAAVLCSSAVLRALCGVAAGSAKACLSGHFARQGNLGELNAKDSSQETVVGLCGLLVGSWVVGFVAEGGLAAWALLAGLLGMHLEFNRRAVRAVSLEVLNRQRAGLCLWKVWGGGAPTPGEVAGREWIFERDGVLRDEAGRGTGFCRIGVSMGEFLEGCGSEERTASGSFAVNEERLSYLLDAFKGDMYLLGWSKRQSKPGDVHLQIVLKKGATAIDQLTAWWHALLVAKQFSSTNARLEDVKRDARSQSKLMGAHDNDLHIASCHEKARKLIKDYEGPLREAGWDLDVAVLETTSSTRIEIDSR